MLIMHQSMLQLLQYYLLPYVCLRLLLEPQSYLLELMPLRLYFNLSGMYRMHISLYNLLRLLDLLYRLRNRLHSLQQYLCSSLSCRKI